MEEKILKALQEGGQMKAGEVAAAAGIDKDEAAKIIKKLVADGKLFSPKRCYYEIKK